MYDISDLKGAHLPFSEKRQVEEAAAGLLLWGENNLSYHYRKTNRAIKDASLGTASAYHTGRKDGVFYPTTDTNNNAYDIIGMNSLQSKTKETAFQILNCTINNKAHKSGKRDNLDCDNCGQIETIEHLVYNWEAYGTMGRARAKSHICPYCLLWERNTNQFNSLLLK
jgi:hypothetical protein